MSVLRRFNPSSSVRLEKRDGGAQMIVGYAARFYSAADPGTEFALWDDVVERIKPGAFDKAIGEDDVRALFNHDAGKVLGRSRSGTLRLSVDAQGLRYEIDPPDTETAREVVTLLQRGDVSGSSFAFDIRGEVIEKANGVYIRWLTDVKLYDVGPVTFPAYPASSSGIRSADVAASVRARVNGRDAARRDADLLALAIAELEAAD